MRRGFKIGLFLCLLSSVAVAQRFDSVGNPFFDLDRVRDISITAPAALADNTANPTPPFVGAFLMCWDGATWDRCPGNAATGLLVNLGVQYAEDTSHSTGQSGVFVLGVRNDSGAVNSDANGDYSIMATDAAGRVGITDLGGSITVDGTLGSNLLQLNSTALANPFDQDSTGGTQNIIGVTWRKEAAGGSVEFGTATNPVRTDPTGTTTQPVSGTVTATATDLDIRNLNATDDIVQARGAAADGAAVAGNPVRVAGKDGSGNTQDIITDTAGELQVDVLTLPSVTIGTFPDNEPFNQAQRGGVAVVAGACERETLLYIQISQTTGTQLITGTASERIYICSLQLMTATAQNVALVDGTGSVCATTPTGLLGGSTAATGWNFAANGGIVLPPSRDSWTKTSTDADNVCLLQSGAGQVSGSLTYISIPNI